MRYGLLGIGQAGLRHFEAFKKIRNLKLIGFTEIFFLSIFKISLTQ